MDVITLVLLTFVGYIVAYNTYGRFLSRKIFKLSEKEIVPSKEFEDGQDYVPTKRAIIFGHHFTSIAGTGPIVGPAIGVIWGWVPAIIWVFVGSIVMGAVHDFGALVISLRNQGKTISEITAKYIDVRVRYIFFLVVFFELLIVIAVFGLIIALIFAIFPRSVFAIWAQIPIAVILGRAIYRKGLSIRWSTAVAVGFMYITIVIGSFLPITIPDWAGIPATGIWTILLLIYVFIASTLPVTSLLQPRDYINAWQLFIVMGLLVLGIGVSAFAANLSIVAPAFNLKPQGAPPIIPFLFITIACGAISGFHALVSSGTSSKQISRPQDALFIGYGSMLMEAVLATLVIVAVCAGIGLAYKAIDGQILKGTLAWNQHYISWAASRGLGSKINAMVIGSANMIETLGIHKTFATVLIGLFIASFAATTLDSATRIQRYVVSELFLNLNIKFMINKYAASAFAVITAAMLAFATGANGKGALALWPMFGAVNQLLAALTLLLLAEYLKKRGKYKYLVAAIPCVFMLIITIWAVLINEINFIKEANWLLVVINGAVMVLSIWVVVESLIVFNKKRNPPLK